MQHKDVRTLGPSVKGDCQDLSISDVVSDLYLCLLPIFMRSSALMAIEGNIPPAVIIINDFLRKDKFLTVLRLCCLPIADAVVRIRENEIRILQKKRGIIEP